ncbi:MAG: cytochrome c [Devosia sp.]
MPIKRLAIAILAATLSLAAIAVAQGEVVVNPAISTMTNDQLVEMRQAHMKENGGILRGAAQLTGADAVAAATTLLQNFTDFPALFKEGSITDKSGAKPEIWTNWEDFKARFDKDSAAAQAMLVAATAGDTAGYTAAIQEIGGSCGGCHQAYRGR